jgi:hypothetical protein
MPHLGESRADSQRWVLLVDQATSGPPQASIISTPSRYYYSRLIHTKLCNVLSSRSGSSFGLSTRNMWWLGFEVREAFAWREIDLSLGLRTTVSKGNF